MPVPNPVAFSIFGLDIMWYAILITSGIIIATAICCLRAPSHGLTSDQILNFVIICIPAAIIGARAYFVACNWDYYGKDLKAIFDLRSGGLAIYGGVILVFIGGFTMCYIRKIPFRELADYCVVYLPLGQAIGRWGNFFNQECFGTTTNLPWGMTSSVIESYLKSTCPTLVSTMPVHPTFLYESLADLAIFFIPGGITNSP